MATSSVKLKPSAWPARSRKQQVLKPQTKKRRKKRKKPVSCKLERAFKVLGDSAVFTERDCPEKLRKIPENVDLTIFGQKTINVDIARLQAARRTVGLFRIPSGLSIASMQVAYPEMFGDLHGLIPQIYNLESNEPNPWNWFIVSRLSLVDSPNIFLLIELVYVHIAHRLKTGKNFFREVSIVCYAEEQRSRVVVFFDKEGRVSIPAGNFLEEQGYSMGRRLR
ncbi:MAG: hypothetical protein WCO09_01665 [bacterium]